MPDYFDTTSFAGLQRENVGGAIEWIPAVRLKVALAFEAINGFYEGRRQSLKSLSFGLTIADIDRVEVSFRISSSQLTCDRIIFALGPSYHRNKHNGHK